MSISARRQLEPRWRHATFIAGLCCELHRLMSHIIVTDAAGEAWPAFLQPLADWLATRGSERYFLRWRPQAVEARGLGLFALPHVVAPAVMADLSEGNTVIVPHLLASIGGIPVYRDHNILDELVRRSLALVIDRNLAASTDRYGSPQYGSHLERYLVDALRRLARGNSAWVPNREKSRLWFGQDGLFLIWPGAPRMSTNYSRPTNWPASPRRPRPCWNCCWPLACSKRQRRAARPGPSSRPAPRLRSKPSSSRPRPFSSRESIRPPSPCPRHWNSSQRRRLRQLRRRRLHPCHRRHR
jgi:hypothetical protein